MTTEDRREPEPAAAEEAKPTREELRARLRARLGRGRHQPDQGQRRADLERQALVAAGNDVSMLQLVQTALRDPGDAMHALSAMLAATRTEGSRVEAEEEEEEAPPPRA
jgi:hypothetical protein